MHKPTTCLTAAYAERAAKYQTPPSEQQREAFHDLAFLAGALIEGSTYEKKEARTTLKKLIGRGRILLNAADFSAGLAKGHAKPIATAQGSILCRCGEPVRGRPCNCAEMAIGDTP